MLFDVGKKTQQPNSEKNLFCIALLVLIGPELLKLSTLKS